jgi:hypothetical protein
VFDSRNRESRETEARAKRKSADKSNRKRPPCTPAELRAEEADGDHCEHVIGSEKRMRNTRDEVRGSVPWMGMKRGGNGKRSDGQSPANEVLDHVQAVTDFDL